MPNKIIEISLQSIEYGGNNLGSDIACTLALGGLSVLFGIDLKHGNTRVLDRPLLRFHGSNDIENIHVSATITEEDLIHNDTGSGFGNLVVDLKKNSTQAIGSVSVYVIGSGGDKGSAGLFVLNFVAKLEEVNRYVPDVSRGWLRVRMEDSASIESLPYTMAVSYEKTERQREYFTILEGVHRGKNASVSLNADRTSRFSTTDPRSRGVRLRFTKSQGILEIISTGLRYEAITDLNNPIPNGNWDIEIPDFPHSLGASYETRAQRAKTWFRLGHSGDRYLHTGQVSAGCVTVREIQRWDELYSLLIISRKGDGVSIGVLEVR